MPPSPPRPRSAVSATVATAGVTGVVATLAAAGLLLLPGQAVAIPDGARPEVPSQQAPGRVEAETMPLTVGAGQAYTDATASAGRALLYWSQGSAGASLSAAAGAAIVLRAKGEVCAGAPHLALSIDGAVRASVEVAAPSWQNYQVGVAWPGGQHRVEVAFVDDHTAAGCDRNVRLDAVMLKRPPAVPPTGNPFAGATGYLDPQSDPRLAAQARRSYDPAGAAALDKVASGSTATWYGDWIPTASVAATVSARVATETAAGALPVLVAYAIPYRDCGGYSGGGAATAENYRNWVRALTVGIGARTQLR